MILSRSFRERTPFPGQDPFVVHAVTGHSDAALRGRGRELRERLLALA